MESSEDPHSADRPARVPASSDHAPPGATRGDRPGGGPGGGPQPRRRRWLRAAGIVALVVVSVPAASVALLQFDAVGTALARAVAPRIAPAGLTIDLDRVSGSWLRSLRVTGLRVAGPDGSISLRVDTLSARFSLPALLARRVDLGQVEVAGAEAWLVQDSAAGVRLRGMQPPAPRPDTASAGDGWAISVDEAVIRRLSGGVQTPGDSLATLQWSDGGLRVADFRLSEGLEVALDSAFVRLTAPTLPGATTVGEVTLLARGRLDSLGLTLDTLAAVGADGLLAGAGTAALPSGSRPPGPVDLTVVARNFPLAPLHGALGRRPDPGARLDGSLLLAGTTRRPEATLDLAIRDGGRVHGTAAAALGDGPIRIDADLAVAQLDLSRLLADTALEGQIDGRVGAGLEGPALDRLSGEADLHLDGVALPGVPVRSAALTSVWNDGSAAIDASVDADLGTLRLTGSARPLDSLPPYDLDGTVAVRVARDSLPPVSASGRFAVEGRGVTPATADARARLELDQAAMGDVRLDAAALTARFVDGALDWELDARDPAQGRLVAAGRVMVETPIIVRVDSARVRDLDVAGLLGDSIEGRVNGRLAGQLVVGEMDRAEARFELSIDEGRRGGLRVDTLEVGGALRSGRVAAELTLRSSAGRADGALVARPFADPLAVEVDSLVFADLDVAALGAPADSLPRTRLAGRATGTWTGRTPRDARADVLVTLDTSRVNGQIIAGGEGQIGLAEGEVDASLDLAFADPGRVSMVARALPFAEPVEIQVERLGFTAIDPFLLALPPGSAPPAQARLTGRATATVRGLEPRTLVADLRVDLDESRINAETLPGGRLEARANSGRIQADADIALTSGRFHAEARADLAREVPTWALDARLQSDALGRLAGSDTLGGQIDAVVTAEGTGSTLATLDGEFHATADGTTLGELRVDTLRARASVGDGVATLDTLLVRSNVGDLRGGGRVALSDSAAGPPSDLEIHATLHTLTPLEPWVGIRPLGIGESDLRLAVHGPPDALEWTAGGEASALLVGTTELLGLTADASGRLGAGLKLRSLEGEVHLDHLTAAGIDVARSRLAAEWDGDEIVIDGEATLDERRDLTFAIRADLRDERPRADLDRVSVRIDDDQWALVGSPAVAWGGGFTFDSLALAAPDQSLLIDGTLDLQGTSDLRVEVDNIRLGGITDLVGFERIDGSVTSTLVLEGQATAPRLRGEVDATLLRDGGEGRSRLLASLAYDTLLAEVDARIDVEGGGQMTVAGHLPVDLALAGDEPGDSTRLASAAEGSVDLHLRADSFAVAWAEPFLDPSTVRDLSGYLDIDARVEGSQSAPTLAGHVALVEGGMRLPALGVRYDDAHLAVTLDGDAARIDTARVHTDDGTLTLRGAVTLPQLALGEFEIEGHLDRFQAIDNDAFRVRLSGTTALVGTTEEPRLEGNVQLVETDVYLDDALPSGAAVSRVELTEEEIRRLEEYLGFSVTAPGRDPGVLFEALDLDLSVTASRDTWVRQRANPRLEIQATGDVRVTKAPNDSLRFDGRVEAVAQRSWVEQFGRRFSIETGVVELQGLATEAQIEVQAAYRVPSKTDGGAEAVITLDVDGTLDDLSLTLGSEPSMENADIVSYLATGRPAASSLDFQGDGEGGGLRTFGSEYALGQVTGLVEGLAAEGVGLDVVEIRTDGLRGATLIAGRYVRPELYVGFKQPVGRNPDNPDADTGFDQTEVEIELQALRWLLLNMEAGNSAVSFFFRVRHAY